MTKNIYEFVCHNEFHGIDNGFKNYYNPPVPKDHVLFRDFIINKNDIIGLIKILVSLNMSIMSSNELNKVISV